MEPIRFHFYMPVGVQILLFLTSPVDYRSSSSSPPPSSHQDRSVFIYRTQIPSVLCASPGSNCKSGEKVPHQHQYSFLALVTRVVTGSFSLTIIMSLACLVCHGMNSPSHPLRSYSVSSSEEENRCGAVVSCLTWRVTTAGSATSVGTSKVTPFPTMATGQGAEGTPRLQRSHAVSRDLVRDWNFDEAIVTN